MNSFEAHEFTESIHQTCSILSYACLCICAYFFINFYCILYGKINSMSLGVKNFRVVAKRMAAISGIRAEKQ